MKTNPNPDRFYIHLIILKCAMLTYFNFTKITVCFECVLFLISTSKAICITIAQLYSVFQSNATPARAIIDYISKIMLLTIDLICTSNDIVCWIFIAVFRGWASGGTPKTFE